MLIVDKEIKVYLASTKEHYIRQEYTNGTHRWFNVGLVEVINLIEIYSLDRWYQENT